MCPIQKFKKYIGKIRTVTVDPENNVLGMKKAISLEKYWLIFWKESKDKSQ